MFLSNVLSGKRVCETWRRCVREGHKVGLTGKRGVGTARTEVAEGEQIEEDGEQCVGGPAGTLGGTLKGALGSLPRHRIWKATRRTAHRRRRTGTRERGKESTTPLSVVPTSFTLLCFSTHVFLPSL